MKELALLIVVLGSVGCISRAGPFVTNITQSGQSELTVEKCFAEFNSFSATTNNGDCTTQKVYIGRRVQEED